MFKKLPKTKITLFDKIINNMVKILPDFLTGKSKIYEQKFIKAYGNSNYSKEIFEEKRRVAKLYFLLLLLIFITFLGFFLNQETKKVPEKIKRENASGAEKHISVEMTAEDKKNKAKKKVSITIQKKQLTDNQKILRLDKVYDALNKIILGKNKNLLNINNNLNLVKKDKSTGVEIAWESADEKSINNSGKINTIYAKKDMAVVLKAKLSFDNLYKEKEIIIKFGDKIKENKNDLEKLIVEESKKLSEESSGNYLILPKKILDNIKLNYSFDKNFPLIQILIVFIVILSMIYIKRFSKLDKRIKEEREEMVNEFPLFVEKLLLLLNAGVVLPYAIDRISNEYIKNREKLGRKVLYEEILKITDGIKNANMSLKVLLNDMAKRSMSREIMRFSMVVSNNIEKGSEITEKLQREIELLFELRKKNAKKKGELAETKLVIPMILLLLVIIMITIAPVAMTM
ncbi:MAG: type II secretion system F family protein [Clostridiales Family XIII bacterium]|jgi:Flp pilus assembly protein TadB|nr:type II secretion system F family protein [Clostridiales Family XIII bacterium]